VGNWTSVESAADATVHIAKRIEPESQKVALMNRRYDAYRKLYPALRDIGCDAL
jgi:sugar (pentulose or hexulose) kinase